MDPHHVDANRDADPDSTYYRDAHPDSDFYLIRIWMRIRFRLFNTDPDENPVPQHCLEPDPRVKPGSETPVYVANGALWRAGFVMGLGRSEAQESMWRLLLLCLPQAQQAPPDKEALLARLRHSAEFKGGCERETDRADTYRQDPGQ